MLCYFFLVLLPAPYPLARQPAGENRWWKIPQHCALFAALLIFWRCRHVPDSRKLYIAAQQDFWRCWSGRSKQYSSSHSCAIYLLYYSASSVMSILWLMMSSISQYHSPSACDNLWHGNSVMASSFCPGTNIFSTGIGSFPPWRRGRAPLILE